MSDLAIKPFAFYCPELQSLKLDGCDVSDEGMSAVAKNCKALPNPEPWSSRSLRARALTRALFVRALTLAPTPCKGAARGLRRGLPLHRREPAVPPRSVRHDGRRRPGHRRRQEAAASAAGDERRPSAERRAPRYDSFVRSPVRGGAARGGRARGGGGD